MRYPFLGFLWSLKRVFIRSGWVSHNFLRPPHLPVSALIRSRASFKRLTSLFFSYWAIDPRICLTMIRLWSSESVKSPLATLMTRIPKDRHSRIMSSCIRRSRDSSRSMLEQTTSFVPLVGQMVKHVSKCRTVLELYRTGHPYILVDVLQGDPVGTTIALDGFQLPFRSISRTLTYRTDPHIPKCISVTPNHP